MLLAKHYNKSLVTSVVKLSSFVAATNLGTFLGHNANDLENVALQQRAKTKICQAFLFLSAAKELLELLLFFSNCLISSLKEI